VAVVVLNEFLSFAEWLAAACLHDGSNRAGDEAAATEAATTTVGWSDDVGFFMNNSLLPVPLTVEQELDKWTLLLKLFIVVCCKVVAIDDAVVVGLLG
jgi:hypothetical protein